MESTSGPRIAVLASGRGSNFRALADASIANELGGTIVVLACDRPDAGAVEIARHRGIPVELPDPGDRRTRLDPACERVWVERLRAHDVDTVLLAGFMRILHADFLAAFPGRVLNVHPSLLPAFPGRSAIEDALEHGVRVTGCTVHVVDAHVDGGPILGQIAVPVLDEDTLESLRSRIQAREHVLYPYCVRRFLRDPFVIEGRRVRWIDRPHEVGHPQEVVPAPEAR